MNGNDLLINMSSYFAMASSSKSQFICILDKNNFDLSDTKKSQLTDVFKIATNFISNSPDNLNVDICKQLGTNSYKLYERWAKKNLVLWPFPCAHRNSRDSLIKAIEERISFEMLREQKKLESEIDNLASEKSTLLRSKVEDYFRKFPDREHTFEIPYHSIALIYRNNRFVINKMDPQDWKSSTIKRLFDSRFNDIEKRYKSFNIEDIFIDYKDKTLAFPILGYILFQNYWKMDEKNFVNGVTRSLHIVRKYLSSGQLPERIFVENKHHIHANIYTSGWNGDLDGMDLYDLESLKRIVDFFELDQSSKIKNLCTEHLQGQEQEDKLFNEARNNHVEWEREQEKLKESSVPDAYSYDYGN